MRLRVSDVMRCGCGMIRTALRVESRLQIYLWVVARARTETVSFLLLSDSCCGRLTTSDLLRICHEPARVATMLLEPHVVEDGNLRPVLTI